MSQSSQSSKEKGDIMDFINYNLMVKSRKEELKKPMFRLFSKLHKMFQEKVFMNINYEKDLKLNHIENIKDLPKLLCKFHYLVNGKSWSNKFSKLEINGVLYLRGLDCHKNYTIIIREIASNMELGNIRFFQKFLN